MPQAFILLCLNRLAVSRDAVILYFFIGFFFLDIWKVSVHSEFLIFLQMIYVYRILLSLRKLDF